MSTNSFQVVVPEANVGEVTQIIIMNSVDAFVKDTPFILEFPQEPKNVSCRYIHEKDADPSTVSLKSIKAKVDFNKITIPTQDIYQQTIVICDAYFNKSTVDKASATFGDKKHDFQISVRNTPLATLGTLKASKKFEFTGTATKPLSSANTLEFVILGTNFTATPDAKCVLEIKGKKTAKFDIPMKAQHTEVPSSLSISPNSEAAFGSITVTFDVTNSKIPEGSEFSIKCKEEAIKFAPLLKGYQPATLRAYDVTNAQIPFFNRYNANSAIFVSSLFVGVLSMASIIAIFF